VPNFLTRAIINSIGTNGIVPTFRVLIADCPCRGAVAVSHGMFGRIVLPVANDSNGSGAVLRTSLGSSPRGRGTRHIRRRRPVCRRFIPARAGNAVRDLSYNFLVSSVWAAVFALAGSLLAVAVALALGADSNAVAAGLFGFSPVLTAIVVGAVFYAPQPRVVVYTAAATIFTVIVQAALNVGFLPIGVPTLTAPFVAVAWLFLVPRRDFTPTPHVRGRGGVIHHE